MADKHYIFVDTETTGLPKDWNAPLTNLANWPRIVQIAWLIYNKSGECLKTVNCLIKPNNFIIPANATAIHGITTERATLEGSDLLAVLYEFNSDLQHCDCIVGHNISFDVDIIAAEFLRLGINIDKLLKIQQHCTMKTSKDFCKISLGDGRGYKYPKLVELYRAIFGKDPIQLHDALADITATAECFWAIKKNSLS